MPFIVAVSSGYALIQKQSNGLSDASGDHLPGCKPSVEGIEYIGKQWCLSFSFFFFF